MLRLRHMKDATVLTLKQMRSNEGDNLEYETEVSEPEAMHKMLDLLGWYSTIEVKKVRQKGKLGPYELCLDEVERLGTFLEIEKMVEEDSNPEEVREELFKVLESLGLSREEEETKGYDTQIYNLDNHAGV